ncbi:hypothetical protein ACWD04_20750 [Streptomyces sp. NPDC002911]
MLPPDYQRILSVVRQAAGPVKARQVGEVLGVDVGVKSKLEPLRGKLIRLADRGWLRKQPDGRFTTGCDHGSRCPRAVLSGRNRVAPGGCWKCVIKTKEHTEDTFPLVGRSLPVTPQHATAMLRLTA